VIKETIETLGHHATDRVTGFSGVVTCVCFDLYGCVHAAITPKVEKGDKEIKTGHWFDLNRLEIGKSSVMPVPDFDGVATKPADYRKGPAPKSSFNR
jgi:hypothetical protein